MKYGVLFVVLLLFSISSPAAIVAKDRAGNSVTLHEEACVSSPWLQNWKTATMFYQGKQYAACWRVQGELVIILDSSGDMTPIPMQAFQPETRI